MFQGLRTVVYKVPDLARAKAWYSEAFGVKPYFDEPFYVGFNIGGYELGLDPNMSGVTLGSNVATYWGVPDIAAAHDHLRRLGAKAHEAITDVGGDIKVAAVADPFGNLIGIIENRHFKVSAA
jgi:predicted enzyme related to lactoylglutathione lyase